MNDQFKTQNGDKQTVMWELYERAAKIKYGSSIQVLQAPWAIETLKNLDFDVEVVDCNQEPIEKARLMTDISMKEYVNRADKEVDETLLKFRKTKPGSQGSGCKFSATNAAVNWGSHGKIGAQIVGLAATRNSLAIKGECGQLKLMSTGMGKEWLDMPLSETSYEQEEKIVMPARSKVQVKILHYAMKYEQGFTIKLSLKKSLTINVLYKRDTCWDKLCKRSVVGKVSADNLLAGIPGFCEEGDVVSVIQDGTLSWLGEGCKIDKAVEPLTKNM